MGFFKNLFLAPKSKDPISALIKAISYSAHRTTQKLWPLRGMEGTELKKTIRSVTLAAADRATQKLGPLEPVWIGLDAMEGEIKPEDFPCYEELLSELLYFYMHITLRLAHGQHFSEPEIKKLQHAVFPILVEAAVEGPIGHWSEETKAKLKAEHYENIQSAEIEYASCKGILPTDDQFVMGDTVYATLARNIETRLEKSHDWELSHLIISEVREQICAEEFPKLIAAARGKAL